MIGIIDYGMGNLASVKNAFDYLGEKVSVISKPQEVLDADKIILPGVGAFSDAISTLREKELDVAIKKAVGDKKPFLGICLGMQLIFDKSYENGEYEGLSLIRGEIVRFSDNVKIPHIGWNNLSFPKQSPIFNGLTNPYVYFVHSYYLKTDEDVVTATVNYGGEIAVAVQKDNIFATQFHPEKSGEQGLKILKNFGGL